MVEGYCEVQGLQSLQTRGLKSGTQIFTNWHQRCVSKKATQTTEGKYWQ